ncbi:pur operon repressor [Eubacteriales bacterium KG127]
MKRSVRIAAMLKELSSQPSKLFNLQYFCDLYDVAKSTVSEDIILANEAAKVSGQGELITISGLYGGVKFIPTISEEYIIKLQEEFCNRLKDPSRILGGGFLYTSDIMYDIGFMRNLSRIFVTKFKGLHSDYVATVETKGIPLASMVAFMLDLPLIIIRREPKFSEGSTVSINYFTGPDQRVQKMSIAKRAVTEGASAIVIDDFMRGGGSIKGIWEILDEFNIETVATGVAIVSATPKKKKINNYTSLVTLEEVDDFEKIIMAKPNTNIY